MESRRTQSKAKILCDLCVLCGEFKLKPSGANKLKENIMNWDQIKGNWKQIKGKAQEKWGDITDDEWRQAEGRREELVGLIQKKYGHAKDAAEREVDEWVARL